MTAALWIKHKSHVPPSPPALPLTPASDPSSLTSPHLGAYPSLLSTLEPFSRPPGLALNNLSSKVSALPSVKRGHTDFLGRSEDLVPWCWMQLWPWELPWPTDALQALGPARWILRRLSALFTQQTNHPLLWHAWPPQVPPHNPKRLQQGWCVARPCAPGSLMLTQAEAVSPVALPAASPQSPSDTRAVAQSKKDLTPLPESCT